MKKELIVSVIPVILAQLMVGMLFLNFPSPRSYKEQGQITALQFTVGNPGNIVTAIQNTGTVTIVVDEAFVNGVMMASPDLPGLVLEDNRLAEVTIPCTIVSGYQYEVRLQSARGNV